MKKSDLIIVLSIHVLQLCDYNMFTSIANKYASELELASRVS